MPIKTLAALLILIASPLASSRACDDKVCCCFREKRVNGWQVAESERFRIHYVGKSVKAAEVVEVCEESCQTLRERWLGATDVAKWSVKCDLYLYPSGSEFERRTRVPAAVWGFADLAIGDGKVWTRELHVRNDDADRRGRILVHELTHVVLAEHFVHTPIPRWADEGIAVLSEPSQRQKDLQQLVAEEAARKRLMPLKDLTKLAEIPRDTRQGEIFYGQSGTLIEYLLTHHQLSGTGVLKFVDETRKRGWDAAVTRQFPELTAKQFETNWREWVMNGDRKVAFELRRPDASSAVGD